MGDGLSFICAVIELRLRFKVMQKVARMNSSLAVKILLLSKMKNFILSPFVDEISARFQNYHKACTQKQGRHFQSKLIFIYK